MKFLWETLILLLAIIVVFTVIYRYLELWTWVESLYSSVMITTLVGKAQPQQNATKLLMAFQALISFIIAGQLVVFFASTKTTKGAAA